jgi:hypothetical protein
MANGLGLRKARHGSHAGQVRVAGITIILLPAFRLQVGRMPVVSCPVALLSIVKQPSRLLHVVPLVLDTAAIVVPLQCKKRLMIFPSPAGMSPTKLSLAGNV